MFVAYLIPLAFPGIEFRKDLIHPGQFFAFGLQPLAVFGGLFEQERRLLPGVPRGLDGQKLRFDVGKAVHELQLMRGL